LEKQLTTALGSNSEAQRSLKQIQKFAAETPFQVKELTEVFVKLVNRGVKPTMDQMRKMGDLAAALGKPIEQLNEAILDINNPERWKELGIQVVTSGHKIHGAFKNMQGDFDRSVEGALKMIETFGGATGVAGGMERQMETLGGKLSNAADGFEALKNNLGEINEGLVATTLDILTQALNGLNAELADYNEITKKIKSLGATMPGVFETSFSNAAEETSDQIRSFNASIKEFDESIRNGGDKGVFYMEEAQKKVESMDQKKIKNKEELIKLTARELFLQQKLADEQNRSTFNERNRESPWIQGGVVKENC
jgi:hypothetical protein